jgi:hypothetical protein
MSYAERNRAIKKILSAEFGAGTVTVRGSRGTATGWVTVDVAVRPKDRDKRDAFKARVWELFAANKITIGTYGYDDPGSDYGYGNTIILEFDRNLDEFVEGERVAWNGRAGKIVSRNYRSPDWYKIEFDDGEIIEEMYKRDLVSAEVEKEKEAA